jgi:hypothetical protein
MNILTVNLLFATFVFAIAGKIYVWPILKRATSLTVLVPILLLHATRHYGLMFLAPGATYPGLSQEFAYPAAIGDLIAAILALIAIFVICRKPMVAKFFIWAFNLEGSIDLLIAIFLSTYYGAPPYMGAAYWIPAFWVPALLVTHYLVFVFLVKRRGTLDEVTQ